MTQTRTTAFIVAIAITVVLIAAGAFISNSKFNATSNNQPSSIRLDQFSLCPSNCGYPSPYLSGFIYFNGSAPLKSLQLIVNGTDEGTQSYAGTGDNLTKFVMWYKGGFHNPAVVSGDEYTLRFVAVFQDNSTASATTTVVASDEYSIQS